MNIGPAAAIRRVAKPKVMPTWILGSTFEAKAQPAAAR